MEGTISCLLEEGLGRIVISNFKHFGMQEKMVEYPFMSVVGQQ